MLLTCILGKFMTVYYDYISIFKPNFLWYIILVISVLCIKERSVVVAVAPKKKLAMLLVFLISWILARHGVTHDIISVLRYQPIPIKYAITAMRLFVN